jgi:Uma2 family endonuclease
VTAIVTPPGVQPVLPDHMQLPESDGTFVKNFDEHPQALLLTDSIAPILAKRHPDGHYCIGQDCGIYWHWTDPPLEGARAPDWFYVPDVPPKLQGQRRRSYVLWQELIAPRVILEFVSGEGAEERDQTPYQGKFWVYEQAIRAPYYGIFDIDRGQVEMHRLLDGSYVRMEANERGHYPIAFLGVELGVWRGRYQNWEGFWLRWWDLQGNLLPIGREEVAEQRQAKEQAQHLAEQERLQKEQAQHLAEQERLQKEQAQHLAEQERLRAERLAERLRALGLDPEQP